MDHIEHFAGWKTDGVPQVKVWCPAEISLETWQQTSTWGTKMEVQYEPHPSWKLTDVPGPSSKEHLLLTAVPGENNTFSIKISGSTWALRTQFGKLEISGAYDAEGIYTRQTHPLRIFVRELAEVVRQTYYRLLVPPELSDPIQEFLRRELGMQ